MASKGSGSLRMAGFAVGTPLAFATFFAAYNGIMCSSEKIFGSGIMNPLIAGGAAGAAVGAMLQPLRAANVLACAASTAIVCAGAQELIKLKQ